MNVHVIHFMRSIGPETLNGLQNVALSALQAGATEIRVHMSSDGGTNNEGFAAYHFIRSLPVPVTMHCIGNVESMAVVMYLAGANRLIVPHGRINIHPMHFGFSSGAVDHDRLAEYVESLDFDAKRYADIFHERTQGAQEVVDVPGHLAGRARFLDAAEAVASGIAKGISDAELPATATTWWV